MHGVWPDWLALSANFETVSIRSVLKNSVSNFCFVYIVLSATSDFNSKLQGLVNELRGEIGTTLRGSKDARERLLRSEYVINRGLLCYALTFCFSLESKYLHIIQYIHQLCCASVQCLFFRWWTFQIRSSLWDMYMKGKDTLCNQHVANLQYNRKVSLTHQLFKKIWHLVGDIIPNLHNEISQSGR